MRIQLLIKDSFYLNAFIDTVRRIDKSIYLEVIDAFDADYISNNTIVLTDYRSQDILECKNIIENVPIVFLCDSIAECADIDDSSNDFFFVFKYRRMSSILSDLSYISYKTYGEISRSSGISRIISVCSNYPSSSSDICNNLARQVLFSVGGSIMVISMRYINEYLTEYDETNYFSKLTYFISLNKNFSIDPFITTDSYGIKYLKIKKGINPITTMDKNLFQDLIVGLCKRGIDTIILDVSCEYTELNLYGMNLSDNVLFIRKTGYSLDFEQVSSDEKLLSKYRAITLSPNQMEICLEGYVMSIFSKNTEKGHDEKKRNSEEIQSSDRQYFKRYKKTDDRK